ncbi:Effector protein hopD2 [Rickettsiales bacterium Ac37b]|nr:Effector protein hopD2 [Rickettsiales bacterium Ac37b]
MTFIKKSDARELILSSKNLAQGLPEKFRYIDNVSASAQFSYESLLALKKYYKNKKFIIIDLRQETHLFINGQAVHVKTKCNWGNINKTLEEIVNQENKLVEEIKQFNTITLYKQDTEEAIKFPIYSVHTEKQLVESLGIEYVRLPVLDHKHPSSDVVEKFVKLVKNSKSIIHFHCAAGKGRSTTFLAMYDIVHNAVLKSYNQIIETQLLNHGSNLIVPGIKYYLQDEGCFDMNDFLARTRFLKNFYKKYSHIL